MKENPSADKQARLCVCLFPKLKVESYLVTHYTQAVTADAICVR